MNINIAGEHLTLTVPFGSQDFVRDTEREIASLYDTWRTRFPKKSDKEILAMIAYQYADFYGRMRENYEAAVKAASGIDARLDDILRGSDSADD